MNPDREFEKYLLICAQRYEAQPEEKKNMLGAYKFGFLEEGASES